MMSLLKKLLFISVVLAPLGSFADEGVAVWIQRVDAEGEVSALKGEVVRHWAESFSKNCKASGWKVRIEDAIPAGASVSTENQNQTQVRIASGSYEICASELPAIFTVTRSVGKRKIRDHYLIDFDVRSVMTEWAKRDELEKALAEPAAELAIAEKNKIAAFEITMDEPVEVPIRGYTLDLFGGIAIAQHQNEYAFTRTKAEWSGKQLHLYGDFNTHQPSFWGLTWEAEVRTDVLGSLAKPFTLSVFANHEVAHFWNGHLSAGLGAHGIYALTMADYGIKNELSEVVHARFQTRSWSLTAAYAPIFQFAPSLDSNWMNLMGKLKTPWLFRSAELGVDLSWTKVHGLSGGTNYQSYSYGFMLGFQLGE